MRQFLPGFLFAMLWSSAAVATKFGLSEVPPLVLANVRFFVAGGGMLLFAYGLQKHRLPHGKEWKQLLIFAVLNTTIYLGAFVIAIKHISAGIGSLGIATNPLFIMVMSAIWLKRKLEAREIMGLLLGLAGVALASFPLFIKSYGSLFGLLVLLAGMVSVSAATVYFARVRIQLSNLVINGWQVLFGGIALLPFTLAAGNFNEVHLTTQFWGAVFWLVVPVSIVALQLWFYLINIDTVRASLWLYLCPIFGFVYAWLLLGEPVTWHTYAGTLLVIAGLYMAQQARPKSASTTE